jgi:hypothetical protein
VIVGWEEWTELISTVDVMDVQRGPTNGWLMEVAVVNSYYILYSLDKKESGEKLQTHLPYRRNLIIQLCTM